MLPELSKQQCTCYSKKHLPVDVRHGAPGDWLARLIVLPRVQRHADEEILAASWQGQALVRSGVGVGDVTLAGDLRRSA